jgi:ATP-binding cassette subfamily B protein
MPPSTVTRPLPAIGRTRSTTSLWRLRGYLRPYVGSLVIMLTTATAGVLVALSIPLVTGRLIDGPLSDGDRRRAGGVVDPARHRSPHRRAAE